MNFSLRNSSKKLWFVHVQSGSDTLGMARPGIYGVKREFQFSKNVIND